MGLDWPNLGAGALIGALLSYGVGLLTNSTSDRLKFWQKRRANQIEITSPGSGEILRDSKQLSPGLCFRVAGRLGILPPGHKIWLLVRPHKQKSYWPQGFEPVDFNPTTGDWFGYVYEPVGHAKITIFAVVAPLSAQALFEYYQKHGAATGWDPIDEIPVECINRREVEVQTS
ncbi:hypothetical protein RBB75_20825 (plasmid) [Tunturibacter empetritectus]|uniref:Uncharacterized protein n=1 Tax=Tunturiibacter empetritectus TaxID=3069691 RepID=A0AAU7ZJ85_9BACT